MKKLSARGKNRESERRSESKKKEHIRKIERSQRISSERERERERERESVCVCVCVRVRGKSEIKKRAKESVGK